MADKIGRINCCRKWLSYLMKQTDFMNKIIDARCYFTSKCKISPRVICFIQIFLPQLHFEQGVICCDVLVIFWQIHHAIIIGRSTFPHKWDVLQHVSIFTSHYSYRQNYFFFKNGMFFKYFSVLLHANYIDKIGFDNKMVWICKCLAPTSR